MGTNFTLHALVALVESPPGKQEGRKVVRVPFTLGKAVGSPGKHGHPMWGQSKAAQWDMGVGVGEGRGRDHHSLEGPHLKNILQALQLVVLSNVNIWKLWLFAVAFSGLMLDLSRKPKAAQKLQPLSSLHVLPPSLNTHTHSVVQEPPHVQKAKWAVLSL